MKTSLNKYLLFIIFTLLFFLWFFKVSLTVEKLEGTLTLIITTTAITVAILITYFFSKIFSERQERINRKAEIDELSKQMTAISRISHHIRKSYAFWDSRKNMTRLVDKKYVELTVAEFRSLDYNQYSALVEELGGELAPQAYLALRDLEDNEPSSYEFYKSFKLKNYSLQTLAAFEEYCGFVWSFLEEYKTSLSFQGTSTLSLTPIKENFSLVVHRPIDENNMVNEIAHLYGEYQTKIIPRTYFLTKLNERKMPLPFTWITLNLIAFILLMLASLSLYIMPLDLEINSLFVKIILSLFCANTLDLIIGLLVSIKQELRIKDFYKI